MKIKVLLVDDSAVVRSMLKRILVQDERFELCAFAENGAVNGKEAVDLCKKFSRFNHNGFIYAGYERN